MSPCTLPLLPVIRPARPADEPAVLTLATAFATSFEVDPAAFKTGFARVVDAPEACLLVAETDATVAIGYVLGFVHPTFYANGPVAWVEEITVDAALRGQGTGRRLMEAFEGWAGEHRRPVGGAGHPACSPVLPGAGLHGVRRLLPQAAGGTMTGDGRSADGAEPHHHTWNDIALSMDDGHPWMTMRCPCGVERRVRAYERYWGPRHRPRRGRRRRRGPSGRSGRRRGLTGPFGRDAQCRGDLRQRRALLVVDEHPTAAQETLVLLAGLGGDLAISSSHCLVPAASSAVA